MKKAKTPTIFVIFGATGDLMARKIVPALFHLFQKKLLPDYFKIIGFSRDKLSNQGFRKHIFSILRNHKDLHIKTCEDFCKVFYYQKGLFENLSDYKKLAAKVNEIDKSWKVCTNKLFYIAASPIFYETILKNLAKSSLTKACSPEEGWTRVLVEKPFGKDLKTAQKLERLLGGLFKEVQIYRIDHYLAKEMVQNILAFRFSNNLLENNWSRKGIAKIEVRLLEKIGVEDRGSFYDGVGALRDVGQNHLLQVLALVTMDNPVTFTAEAIRQKRAETLKTLSPLTQREVEKNTFRAQYEGYRKIKGVNPNSETETYFKIRVYLDSPRWKGVPIFLEGGKRLKESRKEVVVTFKHPIPCLCPPDKITHYTNKAIIRWEPEEKISILFWVKEPGFKMTLKKGTFEFFYRDIEGRVQYTEEYERLLFDAIEGDQTLFVSSAEVRLMWRFIDSVLKGWRKGLAPLKFYLPNTNEILIEAEKKISSSAGILVGEKKEIGIIGLGKMGAGLARQLLEKGWQVYGYDKEKEVVETLEKEGLKGAYSLEEICQKLSLPKILWLMVPAGRAVDEIIEKISCHLKKGDVIVDGGNSFYKDSLKRYRKLKKLGIHFVDVGVSGGPEGARFGASLMIGGEKAIFKKLEPLFADIAKEEGYQFFEGPGAGHFVKMVHNGIEYGMMQAIAEGFTVLKKSPYKLDLKRVADVYNHGSVIESRLIGWLKDAFEKYGEDLKKVSGAVGHTGEGAWTVKTAKEIGIPTPVIKDSYLFRVRSFKNPSYTGKILSALRAMFGGHSINIFQDNKRKRKQK